ncbi:hypothetical protein V9T40_014878 [Parthenolecanium corni]|uniref:Uncharacterized protein n=1 Tax=Parthenolecanium corni TaxID=536013 RepID=A0AAN9Y5W8_9HEMI
MKAILNLTFVSPADLMLYQPQIARIQTLETNELIKSNEWLNVVNRRKQHVLQESRRIFTNESSSSATSTGFECKFSYTLDSLKILSTMVAKELSNVQRANNTIDYGLLTALQQQLNSTARMSTQILFKLSKPR